MIGRPCSGTRGLMGVGQGQGPANCHVHARPKRPVAGGRIPGGGDRDPRCAWPRPAGPVKINTILPCPTPLSEQPEKTVISRGDSEEIFQIKRSSGTRGGSGRGRISIAIMDPVEMVAQINRDLVFQKNPVLEQHLLPAPAGCTALGGNHDPLFFVKEPKAALRAHLCLVRGVVHLA